MIKIKYKKASHVGVVLSFVIFITFLIFLYSILEPALKTQKDKQAILDSLKIKLIKNFSADLTTTSINLEKGVVSCFEIEQISGVSVLNSIVKDRFDNLVNSFPKSGNLQIDPKSANNKFFKIFYSSEFNESENLGSCDFIDSDNYLRGFSKTKEYVFEKKIIEIKELMADENFYEIFKQNLGISIGNEFGFSFTNNIGEIIGTKEKNISTNIYVEEIPIQYVNNEANINSGKLNIRVW